MHEPCENGCNGCDECTDYDYTDESDETVCALCDGDGADPMSDYVLPCPACNGG
jgi:hypothetical protein